MTDPAVSVIVQKGNAFDFSPELCAELGVNAQISDPPYSPHVHENAVSCGTQSSRAERAASGGMAGVQARDFGFAALTPELRAHLAAIAARGVTGWSVIHTDLEGIAAWRDSLGEAGAEYVRSVPWIRWSQAQLSGDRPGSQAEGISLATAPGALEDEDPSAVVTIAHRQHVGPKGGAKPLRKMWSGPGSLTHFDRLCLRSANKHPTEKPLDLALDLVCYFSNPGDLVLDLCAGWGTVALACRLLGRSCLAVEADPLGLGWAEHAERRATQGFLIARDQIRAERWVESVLLEASSVPEPRAPDGSDVKTWERAQRRLADVGRVARALGVV